MTDKYYFEFSKLYGRMMRLEILMKLPLKISSKQRIKKTDLAVKMRMGRL